MRPIRGAGSHPNRSPHYQCAFALVRLLAASLNHLDRASLTGWLSL